MTTKYDLLLYGGRVMEPLASLDANVSGNLRVGGVADMSVADERGRWSLRDNENTGVVCERMLRPVICLRVGQRFEADASILPVPMAA